MSGRQSLWRTFPVIGFLVSEWQAWREEPSLPHFRLAPGPQDGSKLSPYPIDMWPLLALPYGTLDEAGVFYAEAYGQFPAAYHPTNVAQYALAQWNAYLTTGDERHRQAFMIQAQWLVEHETPLADDMGGWPIPFANPDYYAPEPWLSAMTQGEGISVLVRAYRLTGEEIFLHAARRAVRTFELDIRDGGVSAPIGEGGVFFEEVSVYPAAHILNGYLFALYGLYDYVALTGDARIAALIRRSFATLHTLIQEFDAGYWSRYNLLHKHLAPRFYHALHITQFEALARYSSCEHCAALAGRWRGYQQSLRCRVRYFIVSRLARYRRGLRKLGIRGAISHIFRAGGQTALGSVYAPAHPIASSEYPQGNPHMRSPYEGGMKKWL